MALRWPEVLCIAASAAGCGTPVAPGPSTPADNASSGKRLKLTYWQTPDGQKAWAGTIFDTELHAPCTINRWSDGELYCTPSYDGHELGTMRGRYESRWSLWLDSPEGFSNQIAYLDAACTQPVGLRGSDTTVPDYFDDWSTDACNTLGSVEELLPTVVYPDPIPLDRLTQHLYRMTQAIAAPSMVFSVDPSGQNPCVGRAASPGEYVDVTEITQDQLVHLSLTSGGDGRLTNSILVGDDGFQFPLGLHDDVFDSDCYLADNHGTTACIPIRLSISPVSNGSVFEAGCSRPLATTDTGCAHPGANQDFASGVVSPPFASTTTAAQVAYQSSGTSCTPASYSNTSYWHVSDPVPLAELSEAPDTVEGHRLQLVYASDGTGLVVRDPHVLYDTQLAMECQPESFSDPSPPATFVACIPARLPCGREVEVGGPGCSAGPYFDGAGCTAPPPYVFDEVSHTLYTLGVEGPVQPLTQTVGGACVPDGNPIQVFELVPVDNDVVKQTFELLSPVTDH